MVLFYVQHLLGIGHFRRTLALARACVDAGVGAQVISGGMPVQPTSGTAVRVHQLELVRSADLYFSAVVDSQGKPVTQHLQQRRSKQLLDLFHDLNPKMLVTELFPFGRRRFRFELLPLLEAAKTQGTGVVCSVRDSIQRRTADREAETVKVLRSYYQKVLIHGVENFLPFSDSFGKAREVDDLLHYTGLVDAGPGTMPDTIGEDEIIVSAGGGAAGNALYRCAVDAAALSRYPDVRWRILAGTTPDSQALSHLRDRALKRVIIEPNRPDFRTLLKGCRLSVSQIGYNSTVDLLVSGAPALVVPFTGDGNETEQGARAARLHQQGRVAVLGESVLTPVALAKAVDDLLESGPVRFQRQSCNGAKVTAQYLKRCLAG